MAAASARESPTVPPGLDDLLTSTPQGLGELLDDVSQVGVPGWWGEEHGVPGQPGRTDLAWSARSVKVAIAYSHRHDGP